MARDGQRWTQEELASAVDAYMLMLNSEKAGESYSKASVNASLRETGAALEGRTKASVEYRMQNISAALEAAGLPYIKGYKPAKNVGSHVIAELQEMILKHSPDTLAETSDPVLLDKRVSAARKMLKSAKTPPAGQQTPKSEVASRTVYIRCPRVKAWVLEKANGVCDGCGSAAPFATDDGTPFLEVHHVQPLAEGGEDTIMNAVALCPNCHRRCHYAQDRTEFVASLVGRIDRLT